jgi:hypothetical protein
MESVVRESAVERCDTGAYALNSIPCSLRTHRIERDWGRWLRRAGFPEGYFRATALESVDHGHAQPT